MKKHLINLIVITLLSIQLAYPHEYLHNIIQLYAIVVCTLVILVILGLGLNGPKSCKELAEYNGNITLTYIKVILFAANGFLFTSLMLCVFDVIITYLKKELNNGN